MAQTIVLRWDNIYAWILRVTKYIVKWIKNQLQPETLLAQIFTDIFNMVKWKHHEVNIPTEKKISVGEKTKNKKKKKDK